MPTRIWPGSQPNVERRRRASEPAPVGDMRTKEHHFKNIRPIGLRHDVKIDHQEPPKAAKDKVRRFFRGSFRMTDTIKMLKNRGALTGQEERWLSDLKQNNNAAYKALGNLLTVRKYCAVRGQHRLWVREDRNKVRMQILKAAVHEAVKTAKSDNIGTPEERNAKKAEAFREGLRVARRVRRVMTRVMGGERLGLYKLITPETLRNPRPLYDKSNRLVRNRQLAGALSQPGGIHPEIENKELVVAAVQALLDNDLLEKAATERLSKKLKYRSDQINQLMAAAKDIDGDGMAPGKLEADRQKVRSLLLLSFAYTSHKNALDRGVDLCATVDVDKPADSGGKGRASQKDNADDWATRQAHELIPALRPNRKAPDNDRETWIAWAKQTAEPRMQLANNDDNKNDIRNENKEDVKGDNKEDVRGGNKENIKNVKKDDIDSSNRADVNKMLAEELPDLVNEIPQFSHEDPHYRIENLDDVVRALQPLLNNSLLDVDTAMRLKERLKSPNPTMRDMAIISYIESVTRDKDLTQAERKKAGSLLYLGFAYTTRENFGRFKDRAKDDFDFNPTRGGADAALLGPKHSYKSLPDLPADGNAEYDVRKAWLSWWGIGPGLDFGVPGGDHPDDEIKLDNDAKLDLP